MSFLKTKAGVLIVVFVVFGGLFALLKIRERKSAREKEAQTMAISGTSGAENAALLMKAQDSAQSRAEVVKKEKKQPQAVSSYDESGDATSRRQTPERIDASELSTGPAPGAPGRAENAPAAILTPSLRLRGRPLEPTPQYDPRSAVGASQVKPAAEAAERKPAKPKRFVPFGRLLKAELVMTLESTTEDQPLIGLIVEPVWNNGVLVIPAGTEVHSTARPDRLRDRIMSGSNWKLVFPREGMAPNGRQISFEGVALDREERDGNGMTWGITDGSYGLKGYSIHNGATQKQIMVFAAEALRAASAAMTDRDQNLLGSTVRASAKNAGLAGAQGVLDSFSKQLVEELERNGSYIRVPAGKEFYIYPRQVIDPDRADIPENIAKVE